MQEYVTQLEKQLPGKAEMDALLSDINQAGLGRGLQFELFRPGQVEVKDYYAELPISIRVTGRYHDVGSFAADVANLSRIVTLHNLAIAPAQAQRCAAARCRWMPWRAPTATWMPTEVAEQKKAAAEDRRGPRNETRLGTVGRAGSLLALIARCWPAAPPIIDELQQWMDQQAPRSPAQRAAAAAAQEVRSRALCSAAGGRPFQQPEADGGAQARGAAAQPLLAAEMNRRKEPLESFPLDSMSMVGSVAKEGRPFALLRVDNLLYQVKVGDYLGQNYGRITKIRNRDRRCAKSCRTPRANGSNAPAPCSCRRRRDEEDMQENTNMPQWRTAGLPLAGCLAAVPARRLPALGPERHPVDHQHASRPAPRSCASS